MTFLCISGTVFVTNMRPAVFLQLRERKIQVETLLERLVREHSALETRHRTYMVAFYGRTYKNRFEYFNGLEIIRRMQAMVDVLSNDIVQLTTELQGIKMALELDAVGNR